MDHPALCEHVVGFFCKTHAELFGGGSGRSVIILSIVLISVDHEEERYEIISLDFDFSLLEAADPGPGQSVASEHIFQRGIAHALKIHVLSVRNSAVNHFFDHLAADGGSCQPLRVLGDFRDYVRIVGKPPLRCDQGSNPAQQQVKTVISLIVFELISDLGFKELQITD